MPSSEKMTVYPFLTGSALRTASLTWFSHIPHSIPSAFTVILSISSPPQNFRFSTGASAGTVFTPNTK